MGERALLRCSPSPVLALHHAIVSGRGTKGDTISSIIGTHTGKSAATSDATLEMVDMRRFEIGARWLIVASILVQPRNWIRIGTAVRSHVLFVAEHSVPGRNGEGEKGPSASFQHVSTTEMLQA